MRGAGAAFWRFSLALYRRPGIAAACLGLQDRCGLDVNLLLFCLWQARRRRALSAAEIRRAVRVAGPLQARIVAPLRAARRALKRQAALGAPAARLRQLLLRQELAAERLEQAALGALAGSPGRDGPPRRLAALNLARYCDAANVRVARRDRDGLAHLAAAFPESPAPPATKFSRRAAPRRRRAKPRSSGH